MVNLDQRNESIRNDYKLFEQFRLIDDEIMSKFFEEKACTKLLLQIILDRKELIIQEVKTQYDLKNLQVHSVRLDILAKDK